MMERESIEYQLKKSDRLCFIRIPKTASTTLLSILDAKFHLKEICPFLVTEIHTIPQEELAKYRLFRAHFDYDIHHYLPEKPVYMTMLRHPFERAISFYQHWKYSEADSPFEQYLRQAASGSIQEFVCHPDPAIRIRVCNAQTRQIAAGWGSRHYEPFKPSLEENHYSDADLLELAKQHLDEFKFVGLTERFQESIFLLSYVFGWCPAARLQKLRVTANQLSRNELEQSAIDAILEANQLDLALYEYAEKRFEQDFLQMLTALSQQYGSVDLETLLPPLEKHYEQRYSELNLEPIRAIDFDFLQPISGTEWHRRNGARSGLQPNGLPFRWTGPGTESTLDFSLDCNQDLTIRIRITNAASVDILDSLQLKVNGVTIALQPLLKRGKLAVLEGMIPQAVLQKSGSFTRLTFCVDRTLSLKAINPDGADKRVVGVAVHRIQIFPVAEVPKTFQPILFPNQDEVWNQVLEFLNQHLQPTEKLAAMIEFFEPFSKQFCPYTQVFKTAPDLSWVVIHKGWIAEVDRPSLEWATQVLRPVFANAVFVVFSSRTDLHLSTDQAEHVRSFWQKWQAFKASQPSSFWFRFNPLRFLSDRVRVER